MTDDDTLRHPHEAPEFGRTIDSLDDDELIREFEWHAQYRDDLPRYEDTREALLERDIYDIVDVREMPTAFPEERFRERITQAFGAFAESSRIAGTDSRDEGIEEMYRNQVEEDQLPDLFDSSPNWSATLYRFKCGNSVLIACLGAYLTDGPEGVGEVADTVVNATMPSLPTDGSKGQWRVCNTAKVTALTWLLGEDYCRRIQDDE